MIDFILTNRVITPTQVLGVIALTSANLETDHNFVLCKILLKRPQQKKKPPQFIENYNLESLTTESTKLLYKNRITNRFKELDLKPEWGVEESLQSLARRINETAEEKYQLGRNNSKDNIMTLLCLINGVLFLSGEYRHIQLITCSSFSSPLKGPHSHQFQISKKTWRNSFRLCGLFLNLSLVLMQP